MTRPRRAIAAVAAATLATLALGAAPANAEKQRHADATKDVVALFSGNVLDSDGLAPAPANKNTDVTRTVMRHTKNRVIIRTHYRDLNAGSGFAVYGIETGNDTFQGMQLMGKNVGGPIIARTAGLPRAAAKHTHRFELYSEQNGPVECDGITYWAHLKKDRARMSIPRECLGNPSWVRLGAAAISFDLVKERILADDALTGPLQLEDFGMSRKLKRG